jgi:hypothetical protein
MLHRREQVRSCAACLVGLQEDMLGALLSLTECGAGLSTLESHRSAGT